MVDNDEFRRNVPKGFQGAAKAVFNRMDPERAIRLSTNAAGIALKAGGCPGLDDIIGVVAASSEVGVGDRVAAAARDFDLIARRFPNDRTLRAIRAAQTVLRTRTAPLPGTRDSVGQEVVVRFVVDFVDSNIFVGKLLGALIESGKETFATYHTRRLEFLDELRQSPNVAKLATELLADPNGGSVEQQRVKRREQDQRAHLGLPLDAA